MNASLNIGNIDHNLNTAGIMDFFSALAGIEFGNARPPAKVGAVMLEYSHDQHNDYPLDPINLKISGRSRVHCSLHPSRPGILEHACDDTWLHDANGMVPWSWPNIMSPVALVKI